MAVELGTILGVWAHPDDETYLSAGLMAAAVDAGSRVVCITATRGEGGSMDEEQWPPESMGQVREQELIRSLAAIGVTEHHWLDLPDIDMDTSLPEAGAPMVREIMDAGAAGHGAHVRAGRDDRSSGAHVRLAMGHGVRSPRSRRRALACTTPR